MKFTSSVASLFIGFTACLWAEDDGGSVSTQPFALREFENPAPNFVVSPATGMTREGWIACGKHILEGAFSHVRNLEDPMFLPKQPGPGYPSDNKTANRQQRSAAIFEAIARTYNIAAPLIREDPNIRIRGIRLKDYYKYHFLQLLTNSDCSYFIGHASGYKAQVQQTCEIGNLCVWMLLAPDAFWGDLSQTEKDAVASAIGGWAIGHTLPHNWRWFNVMMSTFLACKGYPFDQNIMANHLDHLILLHAGQGWYRDTSCDYYTCHVFQHFAAVWIRFYGRQHDPARASQLDRHIDEFGLHYPQIFSRKGEVIMYGRSILYRMGATAGMTASQMLDRPSRSIRPGEARRIASAALLQFTSHPEFFKQGIPSLGFYGPFPPAIQGYSCSASPYWMFGSFSCLTLPKDHPFWTDFEEPGHWGVIGSDVVCSDYWGGPGFLISNHGGSGCAEIRPSKIHSQDPSYSRLVYSSAFPWEANLSKGVSAAVLTLERDGNFELPEHVSSAGYRDGVLYRQAVFGGHLPPIVDMATIVIPGGEIRIERLRRLRPCAIHLGHFGLPHLGGTAPQIVRRDFGGHDSVQAAIPGRRLALTLYQGWDRIGVDPRHGLHPEAECSTLLRASRSEKDSAGPVALMISVLLHRCDDREWSEDELQPIGSLVPLVEGLSPAMGGFRLMLRSGQEYTVDYQDIDGSDSRW